MRKIHLEKVTYDNIVAVHKLKVTKEQRHFVASNDWSIMEAYLSLDMGRHVYPFAIYFGKKVVGFVMIGYHIFDEGDPDFVKNNYCIWRFMIDKNYQGKGYGREAMKKVIELIKSFPAGKTDYCWLSYEPENEIARKLYLSLGFEERLDLYKENMEIPALLKL